MDVRGCFHIGSPAPTSLLCEEKLEPMPPSPRLHVFWKSLDPGPSLTSCIWPMWSWIPQHNVLVILQPTRRNENQECQYHGCPALSAVRCHSETSMEMKQFSGPMSPSHTAMNPFPSTKSESSYSTKCCLRHFWFTTMELNFWTSKVYKLINCSGNIYILLSISCFSLQRMFLCDAALSFQLCHIF